MKEDKETERKKDIKKRKERDEVQGDIIKAERRTREKFLHRKHEAK